MWAGDITYLATREGWLYRAVVLDLGTRKVIDWAIGATMERSLVLDALRSGARKPSASSWLPDSGWVAQAIEHLALARAITGNIHEAAILEGYADAALRRLNNARETTESITYDRLNAILREALEAAVLL